MIFVIGGTSQGKRAFVRSMLPSWGREEGDTREPRSAAGGAGEILWTDGALADWDQFMQSGFCMNFHRFIRRLLSGEMAFKAMEGGLVRALMKECPHRILVTDEIGYGIVPIDGFERRYREETGRICCEAAGQAAQVWRVCCGLGQRIK